MGLSCILTEAASLEAGNTDANVQRLIDGVALGLEDGNIEDSLLSAIAAAERSLDPTACQSHLDIWLTQQGSSE